MPEEKIGRIIHYWPRAGAAQIELERHVIHVGDKIRIQGHGHDFTQRVSSLEIDHVARPQGAPGEFVAIAVNQPVKEGDEVRLVE